MGRLRLILLLMLVTTTLFGVSFAQNNPLKDPNICGRPECKEGGKFVYRPGIRHNYKYAVNVSSLFVGTSKNESSLFIEGDVHLDFISHCDGILTLSDVTLRKSFKSQGAGDSKENTADPERLNVWSTENEDETLHEHSQAFGDVLTEFSMRFAFHDGLVTEVCPYEEEKNWVLNFKKGILTMLHNSMRRFDLDHEVDDEEDVRGRCKTKYRVQGPKGTSLIVEKYKDMSTCESRSRLHSMIQSTPYNFRVNYKGKSLLKSEARCEFSIDHRIYQNVECEESHIFEPFSNRAAGATTIVRQRLTLIDEVPEIVEEQAPIERRTPLLYDHVPTPKPTSGELKSSRDLIKKLCRVSADDVRTEFSDLFTKFIHTARLLSSPALKALHNHASTLCDMGKKHVIDVLPYLGSDASIELMKTIVLNDGAPENVIRDWMMSIALVPLPSKAMVTTAYELLQGRKDPATVLAISSMAHTYCKQNVDCRMDSDAIDGIIQLLEDRASEAYNSHKEDRKTQETLLVALKALANVGVASESFKEELRMMTEDVQLDVAIRVAAVEAHRRLPCEETRQYFENFFRNENEDSEVRIAAYLQVMRCPNYLVIRTIKHSLEYEEVNQVGSFIWSHLHNLLKSSIPSRVEIQGLLSDKDLTKKFSSDVRKFSHNYEGSVFFEEYNVGGNYESNVIFSQNSYIPRSAMLNVTVDLFGESINLLEVYGRLEGFEHYAESIFGPKGEYGAKNLRDKIPQMRFRRDAPDGNEYDNAIDQLGYKMDNNFGSPKVALGMKLFGNELKYATFNGDEEIRTALQNLDPFEHLKRILSGREINFNKAAMFLDTSYVVSSGAGLPVTLNAVGTTSINLQLKGSLDAENFLKTKEMDVGTSINPSIALDIVGTMSVDAYFASTGIKLKTSMHTTTAIDAHLKIRGMKLLSIKFGLPKTTNEIIGVRSELIIMKGSGEELQEGIEKYRVQGSACTWPAVDKTLGLKLCADYHFANVTDIANVPHFIMAGPAGFRLSLQKSDPTAITYLLEYKWEETPASSYMSLTLDTPDSSIPRIMGANMTIDKESQNLTLLLRSTEGTVLARGKYKNTDTEKYLQLGLDINNQKNFDALLSLEKQEIRNGFLYEPKLYLGINEERVADLQGSVKLISKAGISQYDVDLKFKTKRLASKLFGYVSLSKTSVTSTLKLDYKFVDKREHEVLVDVTLARRFSPNMEVITAEAKVAASAYPSYNFNSTLTLQRAAGHILLKGLLNASPHLNKNLTVDRDMLTMNVFLTYRSLKNGTRFKASASLFREKTELDVKALLSYAQMGYGTDVTALVRTGRDKDVIISVYWYHPRQMLELYEGRLNVTIPTFKPMVLEGKLKEKNSGDYTVELDCSWFSGHKFDVKGLYQDRSTDLEAIHHLKLLVQSPSFSEINADCYYHRNNTVFKIDIKADHNDDQYGLNVLHIQTSAYEIMSSGRLLYKGKLYSISSLISLKEKREISLELHIDQLRDISVSLWANNKETHKEAGFDVKWDANRDPNQKLVVTVYYANAKPYNYDANFYISYPGRTIKGYFTFDLEGGHFDTTTGITWGPDDSLSLQLSIDLKNDEELTMLEIRSLVLTPFDDWRRTSLNGGFSHRGNMYRANGSMYWQHDQHVSIDLFGDYAATASTLKCEFTGALDSTVRDIPSLSASVKHSHNSTKVDSEVHMMYQPKQKIAVTSSWQIDEDSHMKNLTGAVTLVSPFKGFNKGLLVSKIYATSSRDLRGVANLDLDHKEFSASVEGHFQKLSRSTLVFNITTPIEKFKLIKGRFGFSEVQRHLVAQIEYPTGKTGIEVRFLIVSLANFDVLFDLATPLEFLQDVLIVGKLQPAALDFRVGWNSLLAGFAGVWHYANISDFEYSYKIYTPIDGFEENGIVAKLIFKEGLDFEVSVKLAMSQLGVIASGKSNPRTLAELGLRTQQIYNSKKLNENNDSPFIEDLIEPDDDDSDDNEDDDEDVEEEDPFNWTGYAEVHTLLYPCVIIDVDIDQKGTVYDVVATLSLPDGEAILRDEFDFGDAFNIKNHLKLSTPYAAFKELTSSFEFRIMMGHQYLLALDADYLNGSRWIKAGTLAHYFKRMRPNGEAIYNATFLVHTPFDALPTLEVRGGLQKGDHAYGTNITLLTNTTDIAVLAGVEILGEYLKGSFDGHVLTSILTLPESSVRFMKDFGEEDNRVEFFYTMHNNKSNNFKLDTAWKLNSLKDMKTYVYLETPFKSLEKIEADVVVRVTDQDALARTNIQMYPLGIRANASLRDNELEAALDVDFDGKRHLLDFAGRLAKEANGKHQIQGVLTRQDKKLRVTGVIEMGDDGKMPKAFDMTVEGAEGVPITLRYEMQPRSSGFVVTNVMRYGEKFAEFTANANVRAKFDWDLHLQIETSHQIYKTFVVNAKAESNDANRSIAIDAVTPFERLQKIRTGAAFLIIGEQEKHANAFYDLDDTSCRIEATWSWLLLENMSVKLIGNYRQLKYKRDAAINAFYINKNKAFEQLKIGGNVDLNNAWVMSSNLTMSRPERGRYLVGANLQLPKPNDETHVMTGQFRGSRTVTDIEYMAKYHTIKSAKNYGSSGVLSYRNTTHMNADVLIEWNEKLVRNYLDLHKSADITHLLYKLRTPKFQQEALIANMSYLTWNAFHNVTGELFYPGNRSVGSGHINFKQFGNMNGFINATTPFQGLNYTAAEFATETNRLTYNRYIKIFWPRNNAFLNATCTTTEVGRSAVERDTKGVVLVELPLTTRHVARVDYDYSAKPVQSVGHATVVYNKDRVLNGTYNCQSESRAGFDKDTIHVELENKWVPVGADYIRSFEYGGSSAAPTTDFKHLKVYHLHNRSTFDVTGNMKVLKKETGQEITLMAIHSNRTVRLTTNYDVLDQQFKQYSKIEMSPTHWLAYEIDLRNNTVDDSFEAQQVQINLSYPRRNFTAAGSYNITDYVLSSGVSLDWSNAMAEETRRKCVAGDFGWSQDKNVPNRHNILLELKHPSLEKNVTILGEYERNDKALADVKLTVDYSPDPEQTLKLRGLLENHSDRYNVNYTYGLWGSHPATNLQLDVGGGVHYRRRRFYSHHLVDYRRSYLPTQVGEATTRIDIDNNEIEMKRKTLHELSYLWGRYAGSFPLYTANVTAIHEKDINASGEFYLNFVEKLLQLELNLTEDGSQSMHMYGYIPDARSAYFDIWRDYDEDRISDVSYFLKLNHSRLIVASLRWRPELKQNIKDGIRALSVGLYNHTMERSDYWRQYVRSEMADALSDIWQDSKPRMEEFIADIKELHVIEEDLEELKVFLNESYNANEFYIKNVVGFIVQAVDELSIRKHIESLPVIFNEIWEVMGDSGVKIQKSISWIINKIKEYYKKAAEFVNAFFQGDALEHLSEGMKQLVEKYDNFIKDMHVAFIRYVEELWNQTYRMLLVNWHKTLAALEPKFITLLHYLETIIWNAGTEILDFLYIRNSDIIDNPYVSKISNFTHDLDRFYHDITGNDTIGSVYKYSKVAWDFIKEKYFKLVPFGRELQDVVNEIVDEINELKKLKSIGVLIDKYNEIEVKAKWFYDYFDIENRLHRLISLIHAKLTDMKQTALQAENRYREAKTKFFFEPADGIMHLEQKLPMSWHAFNETPKFQEIPEYKTFNDVQGFFSTSKLTFSNFYYDYKPYTDPMDWLPPFKAQAMLVGSQYYVTFDGQVYELDGSCTYLLASDFLDRNFSIAVSYKKTTPKSHELLLLIHGSLIRIDMFAKTIHRGSDTQRAALPFQVGEAFVYQEADIVTVESEMGFNLQCNMKFDICLFEVAGWYFGKTAGLWGTMNNEPYDDLSTPNKTRLATTDLQRFSESWSLDATCVNMPTSLEKEKAKGRHTVAAVTPEVDTLCTSFFDSKVSPFDSCFDRVPVAPFFEMCKHSHTAHEACISAIAYMKMCAFSNTPLRIPDACVKCNLANGTDIEEGTFVKMSNDTLPPSTDIVFIVEAKACNKDLRIRKRMEEFVQELDREITSLKYRTNRYSVVVFGGDGVFDEPRSIIEDGIFTSHRLLPKYFDNIMPGNGSADIFKAIAFATTLIFRPGVSKSFILLPCTDCKEANMTLDYTTIHQLLLENDIALHILMNDEFRAKKTGKIKTTFGVDRRYAYAKKDMDQLKGDKALRKSVQLPKSSLGVCASLSLETNGSLFAGKKLDGEKSARKILGVFAKRVAQSAVANACKTCECTADNSGVSYMECLPCYYPTPLAIEYGDEEEMLAALQPNDYDLFDFHDSSE